MKKRAKIFLTQSRGSFATRPKLCWLVLKIIELNIQTCVLPKIILIPLNFGKAAVMNCTDSCIVSMTTGNNPRTSFFLEKTIDNSKTISVR